MFQTKVVEEMKTHILWSKTCFRKSNRLWDNVEKCGEDWEATNYFTIWRIRLACWTSKAIRTYAHAQTRAPGYPHARTHAGKACTHRPYVILIAFPQQQRFRERALVLRDTNIAGLVLIVAAAHLFVILLHFHFTWIYFRNLELWEETCYLVTLWWMPAVAKNSLTHTFPHHPHLSTDIYFTITQHFWRKSTAACYNN
jgi:hypothetical protein